MARKIHHVRYQDGTPAFKAAFDAAFPGLPADMTMEEAERRITAALVAYDGVRLSEQAQYEMRRERIEKVAEASRLIGEALRPALREVGEEAARAGRTLGALRPNP